MSAKTNRLQKNTSSKKCKNFGRIVTQTNGYYRPEMYREDFLLLPNKPLKEKQMTDSGKTFVKTFARSARTNGCETWTNTNKQKQTGGHGNIDVKEIKGTGW